VSQDRSADIENLGSRLRKSPRVGAEVAAILRESILDGSLSNGQLLPKEDDLVASFHVSRQSIREAMRILETEGLVTVQRGNVGGARVHAPNAGGAAYMLSMVLQKQGTTFGDLAVTLRHLEPICAELCALRADRATAVVPQLRALNTALRDVVAEEEEFTRVARSYHQTIVALSGNHTIELIIGTLELLWSAQAQTWAQRATTQREYPSRTERSQVLRAHERITDHIEAGDGDKARLAFRRHVEAAQEHMLSWAESMTISSLPLRLDIRPA
jgi:GntR family transcriptional regulator, transcriptional repressor for pyruvate dehydrogenase complex